MSEIYDPLDSSIVFTAPQVASESTVASTFESRRVQSQKDFIRCLGIAQHFNVDFLPITWQPTLKVVGAGATARVHQSTLNVETDFAFKRCISSRKCFSEDEERKLFRALLREIQTLSLHSIREHPNIINLAGLCWDVIPESGRVWPVLVFEKSKHGNLRAFMQNGLGRQLNFECRLRLCADIAKAIICLHENRKLRHIDLSTCYGC